MDPFEYGQSTYRRPGSVARTQKNLIPPHWSRLLKRPRRLHHGLHGGLIGFDRHQVIAAALQHEDALA